MSMSSALPGQGLDGYRSNRAEAEKRSSTNIAGRIGGDEFAGFSMPRITKDAIGYNIS
ncbi:MAG: hypothetical protein Q7T83_00070 [Thermodesulfovibrionales bacterium]|nr:hypothetical protein [Thermodesulfovibrionales bacterium]